MCSKITLQKWWCKFLYIIFFGHLLIISSQTNIEDVIWLEKIKEKIGFKGIVAKVGDTPIFAETIYGKITPLLYKMKKVSDEDNIVKTGAKLFKKELQKLIDIEIIDNYAKTKSIVVTEEEVEKELKNTIKKAGGIKKFSKYLKKISTTFEDFKKELRFNILGRKVYQSIFATEGGFFTDNPVDNFVKPEEIKLYYQSHKDEFYTHPKIMAFWIVKEFKNDREKKNIIRYMKTIINLTKQGYSFYKIHKLYSDEIQPSKWRFYPLNIFDKKLYMKIENLRKKEGFHIFVIDKKIYLFSIKKYKKGRQASLYSKRVYEKIYYTLYNEKITNIINQIKSEIKKNISVKIYIKE